MNGTRDGSDGWMIAIGVAWIVGVLVFHFFRRQADRRRKALFMAWAAEHGLRHVYRPPWRGNESFPGLPLPNVLRSCRFTHVFETEIPGADGLRHRIWWGEATYQAGSNRSPRIVHVPMAVIAVGRLAMPGVEIRPEGLGDRLAAAAGWDDIDFESVEFSRRFHVQSQDKRFAFQLIDARMVEALLAMPRSLHAAVGGPWLAVWHLDPPEFVPLPLGREPLTLGRLEQTRIEAIRLLAALPRTLRPPSERNEPT